MSRTDERSIARVVRMSNVRDRSAKYDPSVLSYVDVGRRWTSGKSYEVIQ